MSTMNISLPEELKNFVDQRVAEGAYASASELVRELLRKDYERQKGLAKLREALLEGARSPRTGPADEAYFAELRAYAEELKSRRG